MIDGKNFFDQPINNGFKTYEEISKITTGKGDDNTTGCLLDYTYFKESYKLIEIDLSKQHADPRSFQQINFTANTAVLSIIEKAKETVLDFPQGTAKVF